MDFIRKEIDELILKELLEKTTKEKLHQIEEIVKVKFEELNIEYNMTEIEKISRNIMCSERYLDLCHKYDKK